MTELRVQLTVKAGRWNKYQVGMMLACMNKDVEDGNDGDVTILWENLELVQLS